MCYSAMFNNWNECLRNECLEEKKLQRKRRGLTISSLCVLIYVNHLGNFGVH